MALIGLIRVSTDGQNTQRQHDALGPICLKVFQGKTSGKFATGDMLCDQEVDRLGRNLLEGLIVLKDLFQRGVGVKVLDGIAAGEHTERSLILDLALDLALALAEDRRRGRVDGRRPVVNDHKRAAILARRRRGESIRTIAARVGVSIGVVHKTLADAEAT